MIFKNLIHGYGHFWRTSPDPCSAEFRCLFSWSWSQIPLVCVFSVQTCHLHTSHLKSISDFCLNNSVPPRTHMKISSRECSKVSDGTLQQPTRDSQVVLSWSRDKQPVQPTCICKSLHISFKILPNFSHNSKKPSLTFISYKA